MSNRSCKRARSGGAAAELGSHLSPAVAAVLFGSLLLTGCGGNTIRQGHLFQEEDLAQVRPGMGKDQVVLALGTPDTQSVAGGTPAYYYISTTAEQPLAFMTPQVTDRRIVAIYFNNKERVEQVANYGLKDGKVVDFVTRETPTYSRDQGLLKELFRDIGAGPALPGIGGRGTPGQ